MPVPPTDPTSDPTPAAYSLVSWFRRGLASQVAGTPTTTSATVPISLSLNGAAVAAPPIRLLGPGDITTLDPRTVIRTDPADGADAFEPNYLAMVELAWPDLPWMFTPTAPDGGRLRPWICLVVVPEGDGVSIGQGPGGLSVLHLDSPLDPRAELPDLDQIDVWAHAQAVGGNLQGSALDAALEGSPSARLARLISPRKLEPGKSYVACVVPTYRAGVNAALGLPVDDGDLAPAWDAHTAAPFTLPVFYRFRFQTGPGGDFASLARRIEPPKTPVDAGTRPMDASQPGFGMNPSPGLVLGLEGALRAVANQPTPWPTGVQQSYDDQLRQALGPVLPPGTAPVLTPPVYGHAQTRAALPADNALPNWLRDLNLDPRTRAAASAGTQVVQHDQDALLASAWTQWGDIRKANRLLRRAQLARQVSASLSKRHLETVPGDGTFLQITAPVHSRVSLALFDGVTATLRGHLAASRVPLPAVSSALRKLVRPRGPLGRQLYANATPQIVERLNLPLGGGASALVVAGPAQAPPGMVTLDDVSTAAAGISTAATGIKLALMTASSLRAVAGWKLSAAVVATTSQATATTAAPTSSTTPAVTLPIPPHPSPIPIPPHPSPIPIPPHPSPNPGPKPPPPPLIDWSNDPTVPDLLKTAHANLPSPLTFPADVAGLAQMKENFRGAATAMSGYVNVVPAAVPDLPALGGFFGALPGVRAQLQGRLQPEVTIRNRAGARVPLNTGPDPLQPLTGAPQFPQPMYAALAALSPEWLLPGISEVPPDAAALLQTNPRFIEAFMVGLNEEFARELLWHEFPADRTATFFQNFWGAQVGGVTQADIPAIASFTAAGQVGDHVVNHATTGSTLVLLIRAELFRRYPNAVVSAVPAQWNAGVRGLGSPRQQPLFRGEIGADLTFFGFDVSDPCGTDDPNGTRPGYYFLIEQHPTEPRFGLEPAIITDPDGTWNDLSWQDVTPAGNFLDPSAAPPKPPGESVTWGPDAATLAYILMRRPLRVALHGRALLGGGNP